MTINKMQKTVCVIAFVAAFVGFSGRAHAWGFPIPFSDYFAELQRGWTTETVGEKKQTKNDNNKSLAEENAERGNNVETKALYRFVEDNAKRFGEDPEAFIASNEAAMQRSIDDYTDKLIKAGDEYLDEKIAEEKKRQEEEERDKKEAEEKKAAEEAAKAADTSGEPDSDNTGDLKTQTYQWLRENRSVNQEGKSLIK